MNQDLKNILIKGLAKNKSSAIKKNVINPSSDICSNTNESINKIQFTSGHLKDQLIQKTSFDVYNKRFLTISQELFRKDLSSC